MGQLIYDRDTDEAKSPPSCPMPPMATYSMYRDNAGSMSLLEDVNSSPTVQVSNRS